MGKVTKISWTDSTLNMAWGCTKVSPGCKNCYMFRLSEKFGRDAETVTLTKAGMDLNKARRDIDKMGKRIFVNSMSDTFHEDILDITLDSWFKLFAEFPDKQFQILTKRARRMYDYCQTHNYCQEHIIPENVWLGVSVESEQVIDRIYTLSWTSHRGIKFVSFEPLLEPIHNINLPGIDWIIIGGESDAEHPRIMKPEWAQEIIDMTRAKFPGVAIFYKQGGGIGGDGAGGDTLSGRQYKEFPNEPKR